jgi:hypothetical protein
LTYVTGPTGPSGSEQVIINPQTSSYNIVLSDAGKLISMNISGSANTVLVPTNANHAFSIGAKIDVLQYNTGQTTITGDTGVTVNGTPGLKLRTRWSACTLIK